MLILYIVLAAFLVGGGLIFANENLSRRRAVWPTFPVKHPSSCFPPKNFYFPNEHIGTLYAVLRRMQSLERHCFMAVLFSEPIKYVGLMMILYIVLGAFAVGLGVTTTANLLMQRPGKKIFLWVHFIAHTINNSGLTPRTFFTTRRPAWCPQRRELWEAWNASAFAKPTESRSLEKERLFFCEGVRLRTVGSS